MLTFAEALGRSESMKASNEKLRVSLKAREILKGNKTNELFLLAVVHLNAKPKAFCFFTAVVTMVDDAGAASSEPTERLFR